MKIKTISLFLFTFLVLAFLNAQTSYASDGDFNGDCVLDDLDVSLFTDYMQKGDLTADLNGDGVVNFFDASTFIKLYNEQNPLCQHTSPVVCTGFENEHIYPVTNYDLENICPDNGTQIIYVSTAGDDANDGLSPNTPLLTPNKARTKVTDGAGDWVVFKRGDIFTDTTLGGWELSGAGKSKPFVISAYGEQTDKRPQFMVPADNNGVSIRESDFVIVADLHFEAIPGTGKTGIWLFANDSNPVGVEYVTIQNVYMRGFNNNLNVQATLPEFKMKDVLLIDNILVDAASRSGGHSQGMFALNYDGLKMIDNIFDHNGYIDRDCVTPECDISKRQGATNKNHNVYLQKNAVPPSLVSGNFIMRGSASGIQARSGIDLLKDNFFARNADGFFFGGAAREDYMGSRSVAENNVVTESVLVNSTSNGSSGIRHKTSPDSVFVDNVIANTHPIALGQNIAFTVRCSEENDYGGNSPEPTYTECATDFSNNVIYNTTTFEHGRTIQIAGGLQGLDGQRVFSDNQIYTNVDAEMVRFHSSVTNPDVLMFQEDKFLFSNNSYGSPNIYDNEKVFHFSTGNTNFSLDEWRQEVEDSLYGSTVQPFIDPCRTAATYYDDVILGNTNNDNCAIMHDDDLFEAFAQEVRKANRHSPRPEYETRTIIDYIKDGFKDRPVRSQNNGIHPTRVIR